MTQKIPERLEVLEALPRNATLKILKHELRARYGPRREDLRQRADGDDAARVVVAPQRRRRELAVAEYWPLSVSRFSRRGRGHPSAPRPDRSEARFP